MTGVLIKRGNVDTGRHIQRKADVKINTQGECHGNMNAEIGEMHLPAKAC